MAKHATAFTLIELLVVIAIIVVLLALLMPAMDRAVYEAELAVCAANLHTIGVGTLAYAANNKRSYPHRRGVHNSTNATYAGGTWLASGYWHPHAISNGATDDRPLLRPYIGVNGALNDPLAGRVDLDGARSGWVLSAYYLWFGWKFAGQQGMYRMGDRFTWAENSSPGAQARFDVLAGDHDDVRYRDPLGATMAAHADRDGRLVNHRYEHASDGSGYTLARWDVGSGIERGPIEMQFVYSDGHVRRFDAVKVDEDDRMIKAPVFNGATHTLTQWTHLPAR